MILVSVQKGASWNCNTLGRSIITQMRRARTYCTDMNARPVAQRKITDRYVCMCYGSSD